MYRAHGQKIFPGHGEHGDITVGLTNYPYSCFIIASGIFFKQVRNIFLHAVIGSAGEVGRKQPGFIICSSGAGDHPPSKRAHTGRVTVKESNQRWCSDGFEFRCDNGEKLRVTFALDCCDREALHWAVTTGGFDSETVQDVMLGAVERCFGSELPAYPVERLTDNGSCYRANETRQFARMLGLEPKNTAVRSPESNGIAESFVKTIKRDYISIMPSKEG